MVQKPDAMTIEAGLLRTIIDDPDDDTPRLVYADWLEENNRVEQATFIRAQCRLATLDEDDPARLPLLRDEARYLPQALAALAPKKRLAWLPRTPSEPTPGLGFERGFLARVTTTATSFLDKAEALMQAAPVQHARLTNAKRALAGLARCPALRRLRSLEVDRVGGEGGAVLARSPFLHGLVRLRLRLAQVTAEGATAIAAADALAGLRYLDLGCNSIHDRGAEALAASPHLTTLASLHLDNANIGPLGLKALLASPLLARLRKLDLNSNRIGDAGAELLAGSEHLGQLVFLDLTGNEIGPAGARVVLTSTSLVGLARLSLRCSDLTDVWSITPAAHLHGRLCLSLAWPGSVSADMLAGSPLVALCRGLYLTGSKLGDAGVEALARSPVSGLTELGVGWQHVTAAGVRALAKSPHLTGLRKLALPHNDLSPDAVAVLLDAPFAPRLTHLDLGDMSLAPAALELLSRSSVLENLLRLRVGTNSPFWKEALTDRFGSRVVFE
jgi:uncharacterized protein (TIGR02996 family)